MIRGMQEQGLQRRSSWRALAVLLAVSHVKPGDEQLSFVAAQSADQLDQLPPEQLVQLLSIDLQAEEKRLPERLISFYEFQDVGDMDCHSRLLYLFNVTATVQKEVTEYQNDITGLAGLFFQLLYRAPDENSWVWLLANSHESLQQKIHGYFAKVLALSLDRHRCLLPELREPMLDAVVKWKSLHIELTSLVWSGFAFGLYGDAKTVQDLEARMSTATAIPGNMLDKTWSETLEAGHAWISKTRDWFDRYTLKLAHTLTAVMPKLEAESQGTETRLHHQDEQGMFVPYEYLRRKVFKQWALDKGLLRGLIRHVWKPPFSDAEKMSIADFGAGGGQYSTWLNETGLLTAFAFDGTQQATNASDGVVQEINLIEEITLWRSFDWVMCLEVGEHIPKQFSHSLLQNLRRHARKGLVMSWSNDWEGIGHVNCLPQEEFVALVERETGFIHDQAASQVVRTGCEIEYIGRTVAVFRAPS